MENYVFRDIPKTGNRPIAQTLAGRRASLNPTMLSRSAPDALSLAQLAPLRSASRSSLPDSPSCSVGTQTPTDVVHFEFPDSFENLDVLDGSTWRSDSRRDSHTSTDTSRSDGTSSSTSPPEPKIWSSCLRRLNSHSEIVNKGGLYRRVSFTEVRTVMKGEMVQNVGQQLRSIGDDFERSRLTRTRSLTLVNQKKR